MEATRNTTWKFNGKSNSLNPWPIPNVVRVVTRPIKDQRFERSSNRPLGPATAPSTTLNRIERIVVGMVTVPQTRRIAKIHSSLGKRKGIKPVNANADNWINRVRLYQGTTLRCFCNQRLNGMANRKPATAGIEVNKPTSKFVAPNLVRKTARKGVAEDAKPTAAPSKRVYLKFRFWIPEFSGWGAKRRNIITWAIIAFH